jgi:hypothetical protein
MDLMNTLTTINIWHRRARPEPTEANFNVQLGCHLEELGEMMDTLVANKTAAAAFIDLRIYVKGFAEGLKKGEVTLEIINRKEFLDSLADQVVTAVGVGHCANMDVPTACERVDNSNWSKFVDGQPQFNEQGKIAKGPGYAPPDLEGLY